METDDILCEAPGPDGLTCTKPYGHEGTQHHFEVKLPPHVAQVIALQMERLDASRLRYEREARRAKWAMYAFWTGFGFYVIITALRTFPI